ncbi:RNA 3'-terminal phosphate cyclase [Cerasicoccus frondis]|uniref:RNA 3'-terminal phosphate cyclase n=1 Tax=Cerasicoccus frondis TaxID=490090 RepID=UPI0028527FD8|nr:RNA 3'-terminal phosphate cyclase [Cerasicoccus frondis]
MKPAKNSHIIIDGSAGEGGGQVLRSSLTLSMLTGKPFTIQNIRGQRKKPGLLRQHLTCVHAAQRIAAAQVTGDEMSSSELSFEPAIVSGGHYEFSVGTAGSTMLILQTILLPLCNAKQASEVVLNGGTHNPFAPTYDFIQHAFLPLLNRMGAKVSAKLEKPGFFPAGGGRVRISIEPTKKLKPLELDKRGALKSERAVAMINNLPSNIGDRELKVARDRLNLRRDQLIKLDDLQADGPGNVFQLFEDYEHISEAFVGFGEVGKPAEHIARRTCDQAERYRSSDAPVGDYLADQLLIPFALAGGGSFRCTALTQHFLTNVETVERFLPIRINTEREARLAWRVNFYQ